MLAPNPVPGALPAEDSPRSAEKSASRRILVVDDERLLRWSVREALTARGYDVAEASDARSAMQALRDDDADLVLLDLRLPDSDDLGLLKRMRDYAPGTPVVLMTAFPTREIVEGAAALGSWVLTKPFDLDVLAAGVERVLSGLY